MDEDYVLIFQIKIKVQIVNRIKKKIVLILVWNIFFTLFEIAGIFFIMITIFCLIFHSKILYIRLKLRYKNIFELLQI